MQHDSEYLETIFSDNRKESIDRESYQKQIRELSKKLSRLNDLYIDDRITLEELQSKSAEFINMRALLEKELEDDPALKQEETKNTIKRELSKGDISKMDYESQKAIVRALVNKVQVTAESIVIKWRI